MKIKELGCEVAITWTSDKFKDKHPSSFSFGLMTHINITSVTRILLGGGVSVSDTDRIRIRPGYASDTFLAVS